MIENSKIYDLIVNGSELVGVIVGKYLPKVAKSVIDDLVGQGEFTLTSREHKNPEEGKKEDTLSAHEGKDPKIIDTKEEHNPSSKAKKKLLAE